jgi:uncharacterized protein (DUF305 family)
MLNKITLPITLLALSWLIISGLVVNWFLQRPPGERSAEVIFARDMIAHHEQAVDMALRIRERTSDPTLIAFSTDTVLTQQNQIGQMSGWLATWGRPFASAAPVMLGMGPMMGMADQADVNALSTLSLAEAEVLFLQLMHRHHQGGVMMAEDVLRKRPRPEVTRLAEAMERGQAAELELINELLTLRGAPIPEPLPPMNHSHS